MFNVVILLLRAWGSWWAQEVLLVFDGLRRRRYQLLWLSTAVECCVRQDWHRYWALLAAYGLYGPEGIPRLFDVETSSCLILFFGHPFDLFKVQYLCIVSFEFWTLNAVNIHLLIFRYVPPDVGKGLLESLQLIGCTFELACVNELVHYRSWALILRYAAQRVKAIELLWRMKRLRWYIYSSAGTHWHTSATPSIPQRFDTAAWRTQQLALLINWWQ